MSKAITRTSTVRMESRPLELAVRKLLVRLTRAVWWSDVGRSLIYINSRRKKKREVRNWRE